MGDKKNVIQQGGKLLHAPSMQLSQYLYSRKGGHNFLHRVKPPKELKRNASRASQSQERGIDTSENNGGTGADSPRDSKRNSNRNPSRSGSRAGSRAGSRTGSRAGSMDHGDASELGQHVTQIRRIHSKQSGAEQSLEVLPVRSESHTPRTLQVPGGGGGGAGTNMPRQSSHESISSVVRSVGSRNSRKSDSSEVVENSDVRAGRSGGKFMQEDALKPRSKVTNSQKALIQKQRLRSMSKSNLNYKPKTRFPRLSACCLSIVDHTAFMATVVLVIFVQSIYMGLEDEGSLVVDVLFTTFYFVELSVRLLAYGGDFFKSAFNLMDLGLIVLSFVDLMIVIIQGSSSLDVMVSLRLTRLLRLGGLVRLLRFFKPLYLLVAGIMVSLKTVVWAWILMSLIIYVFGLVFYRALKPDICPGGIAEEDQMLATYFGSLSLSVFSVFQLTTLEDWPDVSEVISKYQSWLGVMVVLLLLLTAYGVMNVTVAIFVNSAMDASSVRSRDIAKKAKEEYEATCKSLYQVFNDADNDGNGSLSKDEFEKAIYEKKLLARLHGAGIDVASAAQLFDILDIDNSGTLDGNELVEGVLRSRGYAQNKDLVGLRCDVWRANLSVQEEIRLVNLYFEERLQETKQKLETLKEVAGPVLQRAQEDGRKKPVLKKGRSGQGLAVVIGGTESTEEHDDSISFGGRPSGGSGHGLQSLPVSIFTPS